MTKFKDFTDQYEIPQIGNKNKKFRTSIKPTDRTFKNLPRYKGTNKTKVRFQDWLMIKGEGGRNPVDCKKGQVPTPHSIGKSEADGKWYGWSHRAVYGFKAGDKMTGDSMGKKVTYPKLPDGTEDFDNGKYEADFTIKNDAHAKEIAIRFADSVS